MNQLDRTGPQPLHEQITQSIHDRILSRDLKPGDRLDTEHNLADAFAVSRGTVRRALRPLTEGDLLVQVPGKGTFVSTRTLEPPIAQLLVSLSEALSIGGIAYETEVINREIRPATDSIAAKLQVSPGDEVLVLRRRRTVSGEVMALLDNYVPLIQCAALADADFRHRTLFGILDQDHGLVPHSGTRSFTAVSAGELAELIEVEPTTPLIYLDQTTYLREGRPLERSNVWIRSDHLRITSHLLRQPTVENGASGGRYMASPPLVSPAE